MTLIAEVRSRLTDEARYNAAIPWHVLMRIEALTVGQELLFADGETRPDGNRRHDGKIVVITNRLLISIDYTDASEMDEYNVRDGSTVNVLATALADLTSLSIGPDADDADVNTDKSWSQDWGENWPEGARLALTFPESTHVLPLSRTRGNAHSQRVRALVPHLIDALAS